MFDYRGVGISGGDPLIEFELLLDYLRAIKSIESKDIYTWVYTSGINLTESAAKALKRAGLNELRINIASSDYDLSRVRLASKYIKNVTIEIPAIPDDCDKLIAALPDIYFSGAAYLNLHELRVPDKKAKIFKRLGYRTISKHDRCVKDSEKCALNIIHEGIKKDLPLSINYCSNLYRNRVQNGLRRSKIASIAIKPYEEITESGYIRTIWCDGSRDTLISLVSHYMNVKIADKLWRYDDRNKRLYMHPSILKYRAVLSKKVNFTIDYQCPFLSPDPDDEHKFMPLILNPAKSIFVNRKHIAIYEGLRMKDIDVFYELFIAGADRNGSMNQSDMRKIEKLLSCWPLIEYEFILPSFQ